MSDLKPMTYRGDFIGGSFIKAPSSALSFKKLSPADTLDHIMEVHVDISHVDQACEAAQRAFSEWSQLTMEERMESLEKVKSIFVRQEEAFVQVIARETGKPLWEARTEAKALVGKVKATFEHSLELIKEVRVENALPGVDGFIRYRPRGVFAVLGPFNFPAHLPNGHIIPALVTGNTVVFKPSELTPATGQLMAQCYLEAGLPGGVFNLVQGQGEVGKRLVSHKQVDGVLFTGSYETGLKISGATLQDHWKILALEMGGKNSTIVWEDGDMDKAVYESVIGAFMSSGQRCSCTSRIFVHRSKIAPFMESFYERAKNLSIDHWSKNPFMGPLISEKSMDHYLRFQEIALREGAERIMRGKVLELEQKGFYVTPSIYQVNHYEAQSTYQNTEIFGPNVAIYEIDDLHQAIEMTNESGYGLAMAIFTKERSHYEYCLQRAKVGLLNWNRTTNGASSRLPFGGYGKSGNDRPSAHFAVYYCTAPVASLEDSKPFDLEKVLPGMNWSP